MAHVKTAISLPNELFERLEMAAAAECLSRSALVALALERYFERGPTLTELIDSAIESLSDEERAEEVAVADAATNRSLERLRSERW